MRTVSWKDGKIVLINQSLLPHEYQLIETDDLERVAEAIRKLEVRGAPAIGITAAYAMALAAHQINSTDVEDIISYLEETHNLLASTRPTATNLFWALNHILSFAKNEIAKGITDFPARLLVEAERMADEDIAINQQLAEIGNDLIYDGANILTHCNCGPLCAVDLGTAMAPVIYAHNQGKKILVYTDETRPLLQGSRLNVWELSQAGVPYKLITDNTAAWVMRQGFVDMVIIGVDRVAANGDIAAKIGVYGLAVLANYHNIPFYAVSPLSTIDMELEDGNQISIEERDPEEVRRINDKLITLHDAITLNYAFDITPNDLISAIVTEKGIAYPPYRSAFEKMLS
jgi:methylthioribose-1-phosphate isomerase